MPLIPVSMRALLLLVNAAVLASCSVLPEATSGTYAVGYGGGDFTSLELQDGSGATTEVEGSLRETLTLALQADLAGGSPAHAWRAGFEAGLGLGPPPHRDLRGDANRTALLLSNMRVGPFAALDLGEGLRISGGLALTVVHGALSLSDPSGEPTRDSGWGTGTIGRLAIQVLETYGLEFQWVDGTLDLGARGRSGFEASRVLLTLTYSI